tara:strand:+ start:1226 stop:1873 length:648 start_codon:yes stop_codon:yes gene_type:complete
MNLLLLIKTKFLSFLIRNVSGDIYDNSSKFYQINKIWHNIKLDQITGDYIEFGIYKGKSIYHSFKVAKKLDIQKNILFWGLDSFEGFPVENHNFYKNDNFKTSYTKTKNQFKKFKEIKVIKGFFKESLRTQELVNIKNISFAFIDCDIFESTIDIFDYLKPRLTNGSFIMIDDYTSIDSNGNSIAKSFKASFKIDDEIFIFGYYSNGIIFRYFNN